MTHLNTEEFVRLPTLPLTTSVDIIFSTEELHQFSVGRTRFNLKTFNISVTYDRDLYNILL